MYKRLPDFPRRSLAFEFAAGVLLALLYWRGAVVGPMPHSAGKGLFDRWRAALVARTGDIFDPPVSHWVAGLLLGADQGFSPVWRDAFRRTGTSHLTAVSGYNVGVVLSGVTGLLQRSSFGRRARLLCGLAAVAAFVLLTGSPGSVLRAAVMIAAVEAGRWCGRPVRPLRALLVATLCIGACSPRSLAQDRGFQLSALATFGLVTLSPPLAALFRRLPDTLAEWAGQSLSAAIATAPLIAMISGAYSLVTLPANLAVTAFIPVLMAGGALIVALSVLSLPFAAWCAEWSRGVFLLPLVIIRRLAGLRFASVYGPPAFLALFIVEAAALGYAILWRQRLLKHSGFHG